jgi:hypothetical protein
LRVFEFVSDIYETDTESRAYTDDLEVTLTFKDFGPFFVLLLKKCGDVSCKYVMVRKFLWRWIFEAGGSWAGVRRLG